MTISACIIGKNEEKNLENCLKSIASYVDEIVFVDTGSSDNTKIIAKAYNAILIEADFHRDFSKARNLALREASKDWVLVIDCDEVFQGEGLHSLTKTMEKKGYVACSFKLINIINNNGYEGPEALRLFKNHEGFHYEGRIHEQLLKSIYEKYSESNLCTSDMILYHFGYGLSQEAMEEKHKRNLEIYESYKDQEKDGFYYFNFANEAFASGEFQGALASYERALLEENNEVNFKDFIPANLLRCYYELKLFKRGLEVSNELIETFSYLRDIYFLRASLFIAMGLFDRAKLELENYKAMKVKPLSGSDQHYDTLNDIDYLIAYCDRKEQ